MKISKYLAAFRISWQEALFYRATTFFRFFITIIFLLGIYYLWNDVFAGKAELMGYTKDQMVTYYIVVGFIFSTLYAGLPISEHIREGELSIYLTKPINYPMEIFFHSLAWRLFRALIGLPAIILIFIIFRDHLYLVTNPWSYVILLIASAGAIVLMFLFDLIWGMLEFWIYGSESVELLLDTIVNFFAGTLIPIVFLPNYIIKIADYLPFKYFGYFIIDGFLGRLTTIEILTGFGIQFMWIIIFTIIAKIVWTRGLKRYEAFGN